MSAPAEAVLLPRSAPPREADVASLDALAPGWLAPEDRMAAWVLGDLAPPAPHRALERLRLALALCSRQLGRGHVCLDLPALVQEGGPVDEEGRPLGAGDHDDDPGPALVWPPLPDWLADLAASPLVCCLPPGAPPDAAPAEPRPLVLEPASGRLYLRRWWEHEAQLAEALLARAALPAAGEAVDWSAALERAFPPQEGGDPAAAAGQARQAAAVRLALERRLAIVTGGPGTGKTRTVLRLLAILVEAALARGGPAPRILLLAPTGKAAARMEEAIRQGLAEDAFPAEIRAALDLKASTLHRALGTLPGGRWRHGPEQPLPADLVVVDEASMIDTALMRALLDAVPQEARLVLLGDPDQLASVEAGAVLAEICRPPAGRDPSAPPPAIAACHLQLSHSFRFAAGGAIGRLARAIQAGDPAAAQAILEEADPAELAWEESPPLRAEDRLAAPLEAAVLEGYRPYLAALRAAGPEAEPEARLAAIAGALQELGRFRLLCGQRQGPRGVAGLARAAGAGLRRAGLLGPAAELLPGRALLIRRNDPALGLSNGDLGLVAWDRQPGAPEVRLRAWFPGAAGEAPRPLALARLPAWEDALVMSIHKSQGSEFDRVAVVLPEAGSPLLGRELLYTALTRARRGVLLYASREALAAAIDRPLRRAMGLGARLWGQAGQIDRG